MSPSRGTVDAAVAAGRIYVADGPPGLLVLPTLPNVLFTVRVDATPNETFTLQATTNLSAPISWTSLLTTNVPAMPFDYVEFDVKMAERPQKPRAPRAEAGSGWHRCLCRLRRRPLPRSTKVR